MEKKKQFVEPVVTFMELDPELMYVTAESPGSDPWVGPSFQSLEPDEVYPK